jgi:hypothetical protein
MGELSEADLIWNRACDAEVDRRGPGDQALFDLLEFHGEVMSGGLDSAFDVRTAREASAAAAGLRFLALPGLAEVLDEGRSVTARVADGAGKVDIVDLTEDEEEALLALQQRYWDLLPDGDSTLVRAFEAHLTAHPEDYEPLDPEWVGRHKARAAELEASWRTQRDRLADELAEHLRGLGDIE